MPGLARGESVRRGIRTAGVGIAHVRDTGMGIARRKAQDHIAAVGRSSIVIYRNGAAGWLVVYNN